MPRVLVIEDNTPVREGVAQVLELNSYDTLIAHDGLEGLQIAREHLPDIIVCDIRMPELDGYDVLRELRSESTTASIPFIFLSAKSEIPDLRLGMSLGADDYITKPFKEDDLLEAIKTRLEKRATLDTELLRGLTRKYLRSREDERRALARQIHDDFIQPLAGLKLSLYGIERLPPQKLELKIAEVQGLANQILSQTSTVVQQVWPLALDNLGLLPALLHMFQQFHEHAQLQVIFSHSELERLFSGEIKITAYRVIEEALWNTARHAQVSEIKVAVWTAEDILWLDIEDKGVGFDLDAVAETGTTSGLVEINEQVLNVGGELTILSEPGAGVRIVARIPLGEADRRQEPPNEGDYATHDEPRITDPADLQPVGILIAEEKQIIREGLKHLLEEVTDFVIIGEAARREQVLYKVRDLRPDVVILSIVMSGITTLDLVQPVMELLPGTRVLVFSSYANEIYSHEALRRGAAGYVVNSIEVDDLVEAVRAVASGDDYWSVPLSDEAVKLHLDTYRPGDPELDKYNSLTAREREILAMIAQGNTSRQIADALFISPRTAETHRANIARKLGLRKQADLIRYAIKHGLVTTDS